MPTPWRTLLAVAVQERLADTHPGVPVYRSRRVEVDAQERPCITIAMGDAVADETVSIGEVMLTVELRVMAFPAAAASDAAAEDALAAMEASIVAALQAQALTAPDGGDLTMGLEFIAGEVALYPAEQSAARLGDTLITLRAQTMLPRGNLTL
jgi:hypothetical protein